MSLKKINKKSKDQTYFTKKLSEVDQDIQDLTKNNNLGEILKKYELTKNNISEITEKLKQTKQQFESIKSNVSIEKITSDTFDEYMDDLNDDDLITDMNELDIESQIAKYKELLGKIKSCEKYLKEKKMEIITCKEEVLTDSENSSSS